MGKRKKYSKKVEIEGEKKKVDNTENDEDQEKAEPNTNTEDSDSEGENLSKNEEVEDDEGEADDEGEECEIDTNNKPEAKSSEEIEYEVERIVDDRKIRGKIQYRVQWKGYPSSQDTWEFEENLDCEKVLEEYLHRKGLSENDENSGINKGKKGKKKKIKTNAKSQKKQKVDAQPDENGEYEVSRIIDMHVSKNGKHEYLVLWKGFPSSQSSWEPEENVKETAAYERFLKKLENARSASIKELRVSRKHTERFTVTPHDSGRRLSRRFENKQRIRYFEAE